MAKFVLIVVFLRVKFHQPCQSTYISTFQAVCAFCLNLTSFTSFPKPEAISIQFIFEFISLFNLFGFSFSSSETESSCCFRNSQKSKTELTNDKTSAPLSVSSAAEQQHSRLACEEIGCVRQTFEFSDVILAPSFSLVANQLKTKTRAESRPKQKEKYGES